MAMISKNNKTKASPSAGRQGFALLIAVIFMSVMLAFAVTLGTLGYKQVVLASSATQSQYAFYAADAALECALYADQKKDTFNYAAHSSTNHPALIACNNNPATGVKEINPMYSWDATKLAVTERISLGNYCADVTVYKYATPQGAEGIVTYIFSQGYNVPCPNAGALPEGSYAARGLRIKY
jgi:hypothetical protein